MPVLQLQRKLGWGHGLRGCSHRGFLVYPRMERTQPGTGRVGNNRTLSACSHPCAVCRMKSRTWGLDVEGAGLAPKREGLRRPRPLGSSPRLPSRQVYPPLKAKIRRTRECPGAWQRLEYGHFLLPLFLIKDGWRESPACLRAEPSLNPDPEPGSQHPVPLLSLREAQ